MIPRLELRASAALLGREAESPKGGGKVASPVCRYRLVEGTAPLPEG